MAPVLPRVRYHEMVLLSLVAATALTLGWVIARDFRQSAEDARQLYDRLADGLELIEELQFNTQEVRRILLYALHTSDANRQLQYAEQSRTADAHVQRLLDDPGTLGAEARPRMALETVRSRWRQYLLVRDEVIGLILEGSLPEGVARDEQQGTAAFNDVRQAIADLRASFESDAGLQVALAKIRADRATLRLTLLVASALFAAAVGIYLVNRRAALEGLLRSEAHKGSILQAVPDPIISTDADGRILEFNEAAERAFGFSRADVLGVALDDAIIPSQARGVFKIIRSQAPDASRTVAPRIETTGARRNGTEFPMALAAAAHTAGRDRIWTLHVSDLTERRRVEEQWRQARDAAESAARAKTEFLATMSHELRTPITGVIGISDLLERAGVDTSQRELIRMLRSSATALLGLVSNILDYTGIEAGSMDLTPAVFSMETCVEDALSPVTEQAARKGLDLGYVIDPDVPPRIVADQDRVRQVLLNLLSNGVKFTDAGEVSVHVSARKRNHRAAIVVRVRDSGCGIPEHQQQKLFHRFSRIDSSAARRQPGAGLGLAISERLSRLLGGSLRVDSAEGRGSTFTFEFLADVPPGRFGNGPVTDPLAGTRVLAFLGPGIVGDQVQALLTRCGANCTAVSHDSDLRALGTSPFDVLLVDAEALDGGLRALALEYRARQPEPRVPLVLITRLFHHRAEHPEASELKVTKPVTARALHEALCEATGRPMSPLSPSVAPTPAMVADSLAVLVVEDDDANRRVLLLMLEELGLRADEASSGPAAIERARAREYDVIFMDVQMPGVDGLEAARQIREEQRGRPPVIVALTANVMSGDEARCRDAGMNGYLPKPVRLERLAAVLSPLASQKF